MKLMASIFAALLLVSTQLAAQSAPPVVIDQVRLKQLAEDKPATGQVYSRHQMQVMAGIAARLLWVAEPGSWVQAGDLLAQLDDRSLILQKREQELQIQRAKMNQGYLAGELQRLIELKQEAYVSQGDLDELKLQNQLAANDISLAQARIEQLDEQIGRARVVAPFAGVVASQLRYAGEELGRGEAVSQLLGTEQLELRAQLPLNWLNKIKIGDVLAIGLAQQEVLGTIRTVIPAGDASSQTFEARIDLPIEAKGLAIGQLLSLRMPTSLHASSLIVPRDALVLRREGSYVFRVEADKEQGHIVRRIPVIVGVGQGEWIAVDADLRAGQSIAVRGVERLRDEQAVNVIRDLAAERLGKAS